MTKGHRNPFIPHERALELDNSTVLHEKESKINYTRQQAKLRTEGAPIKQRSGKKEKPQTKE